MGLQFWKTKEVRDFPPMEAYIIQKFKDTADLVLYQLHFFVFITSNSESIIP